MAEEIWCKRPPRQEELPAKIRHLLAVDPFEGIAVSRSPNATAYKKPLYDVLYSRPSLLAGQRSDWAWCRDCEWLRKDEDADLR
jgi:hypothetical protein